MQKQVTIRSDVQQEEEEERCKAPSEVKSDWRDQLSNLLQRHQTDG